MLEVIVPFVAAIRPSGLALDVGSGGGRLAAHLAERYSSTVVGVDPSLSQARRLARRAGARRALAAILASADAMPFGDGSFGCVVSSCALKHWRDPVAGVRECARVARTGQRVLIMEIHGNATVDEVRRFTRLTTVPPGLRDAYVRFAMRTVVSVAPSADDLRAAMEGGGLLAVEVAKVEGLPFIVANAVTGKT